MDALREIAEPRGIPIIEDAAQAHGALYRNQKVGTIGRAGCFSFWEDKIMTTGGEGGAILTADDDLADRMRRIRHHGEGPMEGERAYFHLELGYNYRMTSMQAATGTLQLRKLDEYLTARRRNAAYLSERLGELQHVDAAVRRRLRGAQLLQVRLPPRALPRHHALRLGRSRGGPADLPPLPDAAASSSPCSATSASPASPAPSPSAYRASSSRCSSTQRRRRMTWTTTSALSGRCWPV